MKELREIMIWRCAFKAGLDRQRQADVRLAIECEVEQVSR